MNNKGFTMIELLAIITVLATILLVSFPTLINMVRKDKEKQYNDMVSTLCKAGETYIYNNQDLYTEINTPGNTIYLDIEDLKEDNLIEKSTKNPKTDSVLSGNIKYTVEEDKSLKCYYTEDMIISNMLTEAPENNGTKVNDINSNFLNTLIKSRNIIRLEIHNDGINIPVGYDSQDCSYLQDESVMCYWKEDTQNAGYYEMHIAADGDIYTPYDSSFLFSYLGYDKLTELSLLGLNTKFTINMGAMLQYVGYMSMINFDFGNKFYTNKVTNMSSMFFRTGYKAMPILNLGSKFDTKNVMDMSLMFFETGYESMTTLNLKNEFDTSKVTNMRSIFYGTGFSSLTSLNLGDKFDTSKVTDMSFMFQNTGFSSMTSLNLGNKFDTSKVTDMSFMFQNTGFSSMTSLNLGNKFDTSKVTDMSFMFQNTGYSALTSLNLGNKFDTSKVTTMQSMFYQTGFSSLTSLNLGGKFDTSKVTNMSWMFGRTGSTAMTNLNLGNKFIIQDSTQTDNMFESCGKNSTDTKVKVGSNAIKTKILSLTDAHVPQIWINNDLIVVE